VTSPKLTRLAMRAKAGKAALPERAMTVYTRLDPIRVTDLSKEKVMSGRPLQRPWVLGGAVALGAIFVSAVPARAADALVSKPPTFSKDVAPIFQAKCQECHQPNSIAPMSLITFDEARPWARAIKARVAARQMPPWHIDRSVGVQKFKNDMSLSDDQIDTIVRWVDGGALPKTCPRPRLS
jgi:mono/diheme cytochrome c family protein